jgi:hypothetical protein
MFRALLRNGYLGPDEDNCAIHEAHRQGWIYWATIEPGHDAFFIASPLHAACLSWSLMPSVGQLTHPTLLDLTMDVISRFKPSQIFCPYRNIGPISIDVHAHEAQYQAEFYRSLHQLAHGEVQITPEFASGKDAEVTGRLDFVIPSKKWGIEITREGSKLRQHSDRFSQDGAYGEMITKGLVMDYILVDCRATWPENRHAGMLCVHIFRALVLMQYYRHSTPLSCCVRPHQLNGGIPGQSAEEVERIPFGGE